MIKRFLGWILLISTIVILPFILLIRGAVYFHEAFEWHPWIAICGGMVLTVILLVIYMTLVYGKFTGRIGSLEGFKLRWFLAVVIVFGYLLHGLFFLSNENVKRDSVRKEFTDLHPILRIGVSTIIFLDRDLIVTDANRVPEDYRKMGLPSKRSSLHYKQRNGYTHALDIRTNKRGEIRNFLLKWYFKAMGFNTLRHVGTDDHLHISLMSHDHPHSI